MGPRGCCMRLRSKLGIPKVSKGIAKAYIALFVLMFVNSFTVTMIFPFAPFMVKKLIPRLQNDEASVGKFVGILASAMHFGRLFSSYIWGTIADQKGRKPVLVIGCVLMGLCMFVFGFSVSFEMAVLLRLLVGLINGVLVTIKAVAAEISDDSSQAFSIAVTSIGWELGFIVGPAVSSALADPIDQYNLNITDHHLKNFLTKFPYSLPCIVNALILFIAAALTVCLLSETLSTKKKSPRQPNLNQTDDAEGAKESTLNEAGVSLASEDDSSSADASMSLVGEAEEKEALSREDETARIFSEDETERLASDDERVRLVSENETGRLASDDERVRLVSENETGRLASDDERESEHKTGRLISEGERVSGEERVLMMADGVSESRTHVTVKWKWLTIRLLTRAGNSVKASLLNLKLFLCDRVTLLSLMMYGLFAFGVIGYQEVYALWAFTSPHLGGLGFSLREIGISLSITAVLVLPAALFIFPIMERYLASIKSFYVSATVVMVLTMLLPNLHYLVPTNLSWLLWILLCSLSFLINIATSSAYSSITIFINNSVTPDKLGGVNGVAVSVGSIARTISPSLSGVLFSLSISPRALSIGYPLNYHLFFVLFGLLQLTTIIMAGCFPTSINKQKIVKDTKDL